MVCFDSHGVCVCGCSVQGEEGPQGPLGETGDMGMKGDNVGYVCL